MRREVRPLVLALQGGEVWSFASVVTVVPGGSLREASKVDECMISGVRQTLPKSAILKLARSSNSWSFVLKRSIMNDVWPGPDTVRHCTPTALLEELLLRHQPLRNTSSNFLESLHGTVIQLTIKYRTSSACCWFVVEGRHMSEMGHGADGVSSSISC